MYDFKVLTAGEKIREIRDKFAFKQEDITCGEITRNLVSIIENNKGNITPHVAKVLADGINTLCKERNIDFSITKEYLLEDIVLQAKKIADEYISYINTIPKNEIINIPDKLNEIDVFLKSYNTEEKKTLLYRAIAKRFIESKLYYKSMDYYLKAYESSTNIKHTTYTLIGLGACCSYLSKHDEAINYYKLLLELNNDIQYNNIAKFNIALCNAKLKKFDVALDALYELKENFKSTPQSLINECEIDNLIGICLLNLKYFNKAIFEFKKLLKSPQSPINEVMALTNLADVYEEMKDFPSLKKVCHKIKKIVEENNDFMNVYEGDLYISLAKNLNHIGDIYASKKLLLKALECFKNGVSMICLEDMNKVFSNLLSIFINDSDIENIEFLRNEFFELVEREMIPKETLISLRFIRYYNYTKQFDKVESIINFLVS